MDHCEGGWAALWGGIVVPDVHFLCQPWSLGKDVIPCVLHLLIFVGRPWYADRPSLCVPVLGSLFRLFFTGLVVT